MYFQRLKDLRDDKDLSQAEVAGLLNIRQTVYSRYERGAQTIPLPAPAQIGGFLQHLYRLHIGAHQPAEAIPEKIRRPEGRRLPACFNSATIKEDSSRSGFRI